MNCAKIMTQGLEVCVPGDNLVAVSKIMRGRHHRAVPVVKELETRELVGIVTDRDIAVHLVEYTWVHPSKVRVSDCMSSPVVACGIDEPVETVAHLMGKYHLRCIPVVDNEGCYVGIVSQADMLSRAPDIACLVCRGGSNTNNPTVSAIQTGTHVRPQLEHGMIERTKLCVFV